ncbi:NAD(P)-binding protein [Setomelanomma holmii]|uniref:NAD(P)-binding protein n=1 Tax=Setomelanomma holmii TaxID=210430 RepID=A0A9P4GX05_9PLEO|nr:NAD(P)-binding protein [Setomelanomma holmii]
MAVNILITGAGGYISQEHVEAWAKLGTDAIQVDLTDEEAVANTVLRHKVNVIVHTASSINWDLAKNLISALARWRGKSGQETYFIHTSGTGAFSPNTGWPSGDFNDTDDVFGTEKRLADSFPLRQTDVNVIEHAKAVGVISFIVVPSIVYGRGTGPWNQLSVVLPQYISAAITQKAVYKFSENTKISAVHVSDLTALYSRVIEAILEGKEIERGERGYYFGIAHNLYWHDVAAKLATIMKARGLVSSGEPRVWTDAAEAAEPLGVPAAFVQALWNSGDNIITHNEDRIGWKPTWTSERFYEHINEEMEAVVELGQAKSSLIKSLHAAARG